MSMIPPSRLLKNGLLAIILSGTCFCARVPLEQGIDLGWPRPPGSTKITYVGQFSTSRDLGIKPAFFKRLGRMISGQKTVDKGLESPFHISLNKEGDILVSDTSTPGLHLFKKKKQYRVLGQYKGVKLQSPIGVAYIGYDRILVADSMLQRVMALDEKGKLVTEYGPGLFKRPTGLAVDRELNRLYVVDTLDHRVKIFSLDGKYLASLGGLGNKKGEFNYPTCISVDREHRVIVGDSMNFRVQVFDPKGKVVSVFGQPGDGTGYFSKIKGVAADSYGHIYVSDAQFDVVQVFDMKGKFLLDFGEPGTGPGQFQFPAGIYIDNNNMIYIVDKLNRRVQIFRYVKEDHEG